MIVSLNVRATLKNSENSRLYKFHIPKKDYGMLLSVGKVSFLKDALPWS